MRVSARDVVPFARAEGFSERVVEKVLQLLRLLRALNSHPRLRGKWALKGGTALNLFLLRHPRLSVDIDLNYIGALDREEMLVDRPRIERAARAVFSREGFTVRRVPDEHAGGKWRLSYVSRSAYATSHCCGGRLSTSDVTRDCCRLPPSKGRHS